MSGSTGHSELVDNFERRLERAGAAIALIYSDRVVTVRDIDRWASRVDAQLDHQALAPGTVIGLQATNGTPFVASLLALRRRGLVAALLDPAIRPRERLSTAASLGAEAMLVANEEGITLSRLDPMRPLVPAPDPSFAVIKVTSGSSGAARGVLTSEAALLADERALTSTMELAGEHTLAAIPMSHSYGLCSVALPVLVRDAVAVLPEHKHPLGVLRALTRHQVTFLPTVPAWLEAVLRPRSPQPLPPSLRLVVSAGAPLAPSTAQRFADVHDRPVHVFYGASECGGIAYDRTGQAALDGTLGTPVDGVELELEPHPLCPDGGRVVVRSAAVAESYVPDPTPELADGVFRTGDLGRLEGPVLQLVGRADQLINVRGRKVQPAEVERVLLSHPKVEAAAVAGIGSDGRGESVRAAVTCDRSSGAADSTIIEEILSWCRAELPDYKVPRALVLVDRIPCTERGKIDRNALRALLSGNGSGFRP